MNTGLNHKTGSESEAFRRMAHEPGYRKLNALSEQVEDMLRKENYRAYREYCGFTMNRKPSWRRSPVRYGSRICAALPNRLRTERSGNSMEDWQKPVLHDRPTAYSR